ncbi:MAG: threonine/serine exporter family protein [Clostridia bacterium]|nr:threonine/serine exporter family protein [Clostridia bacterium]MBR2287763.1 threonine/serine exporter family protein [Clostridia bacterium]
MEQKRYMEPLKMAGRLIMENGGETYRVEETVRRMGEAFGLKEVESFAVPSGVFISFLASTGDTETAVLRVRKGATNLERVDAVNRISRKVETGGMSPEDTLKALEEIASGGAKEKGPVRVLASALCAAGFAVMFHGGIAEAAIAALVGALIEGMNQALARFHLQALVALLLGAFLATLIPDALLYAHLGRSFLLEAVVAGALMPMLPGLAMTNAVSDTLRGDMVSGISHFAQAVLTAGLVAGGTLFATTLWRMLGGMMA